jgi:CDP-diacylglycerol pyrophosphatase
MRLACLAALLPVVALLLGQPAHAERLEIWTLVHDRCVANLKQSGDVAPCDSVMISGANDHGYAIVKDRKGDTQYLLIPTERISGIEDPQVLAPGAINYFAEAWDHIKRVSDTANIRLLRDSLSLAINSVNGRSQDQLHIHLECIRPDVKEILHRLAPGIGPDWAPLAETISGRHYRAMRLDGDDLAFRNPFLLLADGVPGAKEEMGLHTLVLVGTNVGGPGFILLDGHTDLAAGDRGNGEFLQDHGCALKGE